MKSPTKTLPPPLRLLERPRRGAPATPRPTDPAPRTAWWQRWLPAWR